jgi:large subunit ribosomal protein L28
MFPTLRSAASASLTLNLREKKFWLESEHRFVTLKVSAAGIRNINKNGLEAVLKNSMEKGYVDIV